MRSISTTNNLFPCASHSSFSLQASHTFTMLPHLVVLRPCFVGILYPPFSTSSRYELQLLNVPFGSFIQIEKKSFSLTIFFCLSKKVTTQRVESERPAEPEFRPSVRPFFSFRFSSLTSLFRSPFLLLLPYQFSIFSVISFTFLPFTSNLYCIFFLFLFNFLFPFPISL